MEHARSAIVAAADVALKSFDRSSANIKGLASCAIRLAKIEPTLS